MEKQVKADYIGCPEVWHMVKPRKSRPKLLIKPLPEWTPFIEGEIPGDSALKRLIESEPGYIGVFVNSRYQVTMREVPSPLGDLIWLSVVRRDREPLHDWRDLQRIKNELVGAEREAVEIYPAESRLVDTTNQYHLWVLPEGMSVPFGYTKREVMTRDALPPDVKHKQRDFEDEPVDLKTKPGGSLV
jgi:hypothetical protein